MRPLNKGLLYTVGCAVALSAPVSMLGQRGTAVSDAPQAISGSDDRLRLDGASSNQIATTELPDSPSSAWAKEKGSSPEPGDSATAGATSGQNPPAADSDQDQKPQRPVGTAAAEAPKSKGVTAAEPSGVAIAPAKQRRVRTIILRVGALVGAGAAIGAVVALAEATPSRPPGAH